jgi:uncharacterized protein with von Willebrand factor type A (vWA) domain
MVLLIGKDLKINNKTTAVAMERCGKHFSTTIELLLENVLSMWSMLRCYLQDNWGDRVSCQFQLRVEFYTGGCEA